MRSAHVLVHISGLDAVELSHELVHCRDEEWETALAEGCHYLRLTYYSKLINNKKGAVTVYKHENDSDGCEETEAQESYRRILTHSNE